MTNAKTEYRKIVEMLIQNAVIKTFLSREYGYPFNEETAALIEAAYKSLEARNGKDEEDYPEDDIDWEKVYTVINLYPVIPAVISTSWYLLDQIDYAADRLGVRSL